jgi:glycerol-3-phosphate cytidylyltransferase-like family protein
MDIAITSDQYKYVPEQHKEREERDKLKEIHRLTVNQICNYVAPKSKSKDKINDQIPKRDNHFVVERFKYEHSINISWEYDRNCILGKDYCI